MITIQNKRRTHKESKKKTMTPPLKSGLLFWTEGIHKTRIRNCKTCSTSSTIRGMQIALLWIIILLQPWWLRARKQLAMNAYNEWKKEDPIHCGWDYILVWELWNSVWSTIMKLKVDFPYDPSISLQNMPKGLGILLHRYLPSPVHCCSMLNKWDIETI